MNQQNNYQFVMIPQQLSNCLDSNCHKMLSTLIGLHTLFSNDDGWFYRSNKDLQLDSRFSQNLVIATLDTLYQAGIINIDCIGKGRGHRSNRIHINFESFKKYETYSFNDIRNNPDLWIETVPYKNHYSPSYSKADGNTNGKEIGNTLGKRIGKKVTTIIDTTDTLNTTDTIKEIYTKENNINNISKEEKLPTCIIDIEKEKESIENNNDKNDFHYYSSKIKLDDDKLNTCFETCKNFVSTYNYLDYQELIDKPEDFLNKNEIRISALTQSLINNTGLTFQKDKTIQLLKDYCVQSSSSY